MFVNTYTTNYIILFFRKDEEKRDADKEIKKQKKTIEDLEEKVVMLIEEIKELKLHIDLIEVRALIVFITYDFIHMEMLLT